MPEQEVRLPQCNQSSLILNRVRLLRVVSYRLGIFPLACFGSNLIRVIGDSDA